MCDGGGVPLILLACILERTVGDVGGDLGDMGPPGGGLVADNGGELGRSYKSWLLEPALKELLSTRIGGGGARALGV